jgi:DNA-binding IclR family transcriptional regulator
MLAFMPLARLKKVFERHRDDPDLLAVAKDWPAFKAYYARIRERGFYLSQEEVESGTVGIAAPITLPGTGTVAAISLVLSAERLALINSDGFAQVVTRRAGEIAQLLGTLHPPSRLAEPPPAG